LKELGKKIPTFGIKDFIRKFYYFLILIIKRSDCLIKTQDSAKLFNDV